MRIRLKRSCKSRRKKMRKDLAKVVSQERDMRDTFQQLTVIDQERIICRIDRENKHRPRTTVFEDLWLAYKYAKEFTETILL